MKIQAVFLAMLLLLVSPAFAASLELSSTSMAPTYINTKTLTNMLNISLMNSSGPVNVTVMNVTIGGNVTYGNVSTIFLLNSTGGTLASASVTQAKTTITITNGINVSAGNVTVIVALNLSSMANPSSNVSVKINSTAEVGVDPGDTVTLAAFVNSTDSEIRDIHANATVSPNYADTGAINQTLVYTIRPTGRTPINKTVITIPATYGFVNITSIQIDGSNSTITVSVGNVTDPRHINITLTPSNQSTLNPIKVWFTVNTSMSNASGLFTSAIEGNGLGSVSTDVAGSVNVSTQQLIRSAIITPTKLIAFINGTDYWEFNLTLNFTTNVSGLLQFRMTNWNNTANQTINLNDTSTYYATLRNETGFSTANKFNITNAYTTGTGVTLTNMVDGLTFTPILRMVIPVGTAVSTTWYTTYDMLFKALPA